MDKDNELVIGVDYETAKSLMERTGISRGTIYQRINELKSQGITLLSAYMETKGRPPMVYWLMEDANKIIDFKPSRERKHKKCKPNEVTPIPEGFILGEDYHTELSLTIGSKYKTLKDVKLRIMNLERNSGLKLNTKFSDIYTRYWLKVDADNIISYRKKRSK